MILSYLIFFPDLPDLPFQLLPSPEVSLEDLDSAVRRLSAASAVAAAVEVSAKVELATAAPEMETKPKRWSGWGLDEVETFLFVNPGFA